MPNDDPSVSDRRNRGIGWWCNAHQHIERIRWEDRLYNVGACFFKGSVRKPRWFTRTRHYGDPEPEVDEGRDGCGCGRDASFAQRLF